MKFNALFLLAILALARVSTGAYIKRADKREIDVGSRQLGEYKSKTKSKESKSKKEKKVSTVNGWSAVNLTCWRIPTTSKLLVGLVTHSMDDSCPLFRTRKARLR